MKNKGFVLVETIVTSVFVLGLFSFLIANILPLVGEYEKTLDYDSMESKYDAHLIRKMILRDENQCRIYQLVEFPTASTNKGYYLFEGDSICGYVSNVNYCKTLLSENFLDVNKIILTEYETSNLKSKASSFERAIEEYIKYMPKYNNTVSGTSTQYFYHRRLIIYFNDGRITNIELLLDRDIKTNCEGAPVC